MTKRSLKARVLLPVLALLTGFVMLFTVGVAWAHFVTFQTTLTINAPNNVQAGHKFTVTGKAKSAKAACRKNRAVTLFIDGHADGSDNTNAGGDYTIHGAGLTPGNHTVYTKTPPKILVSRHNHRHKCSRAKSDTQTVHAA